MVSDGRLPQPTEFDGELVWDLVQLDRAMDRLTGLGDLTGADHKWRRRRAALRLNRLRECKRHQPPLLGPSEGTASSRPKNHQLRASGHRENDLFHSRHCCLKFVAV